MRTQSQTTSRDAVEWVRALRDSRAAVKLDRIDKGGTFYLTHARGDFWLTTSSSEPRNLRSYNWSEAEVIKQVQDSEVVPMELSEAPFGHLVQHSP